MLHNAHTYCDAGPKILVTCEGEDEVSCGRVPLPLCGHQYDCSGIVEGICCPSFQFLMCVT